MALSCTLLHKLRIAPLALPQSYKNSHSAPKCYMLIFVALRFPALYCISYGLLRLRSRNPTKIRIPHRSATCSFLLPCHMPGSIACKHALTLSHDRSLCNKKTCPHSLLLLGQVDSTFIYLRCHPAWCIQCTHSADTIISRTLITKVHTPSSILRLVVFLVALRSPFGKTLFAAITPPAALSEKGGFAYSLFLNGFDALTLPQSFPTCQSLFFCIPVYLESQSSYFNFPYDILDKKSNRKK